jgi:hypothetical protein
MLPGPSQPVSIRYLSQGRLTAQTAVLWIHPIFIARPVNRTDSGALDFQVAYPGEDLSENRSWKNEVTVISSLPEVLDKTIR